MIKNILRSILLKVAPTYAVLDKSFFELNKRIDKIDEDVLMLNHVLYELSSTINNGQQLLANQKFSTEHGEMDFYYSVFNVKDFRAIVNEILVPNLYNADKSATYFFSDMNLGANDVVIDIGGNIGMFSIPLAKAFPETKILCFEPLSKNFEVLEMNIAKNNIKNITAIKKGVAGSSTKDSFIWKPFHNGGSGLVSESTSSVQAFVLDSVSNKYLYEPVELVSLDDVFAEYNIKELALLKMDCEGGEYDISFSNKCFNSNQIKELRGEVHLLPSDLNGKEYIKLSKHLKSIFPNKLRMDCMNDYDSRFGI